MISETTPQTAAEATDFGALVERVKQEIVADIRAGVVPRSVSSFAELHDYVDANCYGGVCEDEIYEALIWHFSGRTGQPDPGVLAQIGGMTDAMADYLNRVQASVDDWLRSGAHAEEV